MIKNNQPTLYWYDYETFGVNPRRDRPVQFGGIRTDLELNPVDEPLSLFCRPGNDFLPHPESCLITGITPQKAIEEGVSEFEFISRIHAELSRPNTCMVGYNNIRFDDEVTRFTLYRNLYDPYSHEWQNGNSRWDIIDVVRLTHALRPEGIQWPKNDRDQTSFRLDQLTVSNNISHESAHDALSDVYATIAVARLIRDKQPRLFDYVFEHRSKQSVYQLLGNGNWQPVLHVSAMYQAGCGNIALVLPLVIHPKNKNEILVYDLRVDPGQFASLSKEEVRDRLFTRQQDLPEDVQRLPVKSIHINKSPVVVPVNTLSKEAAEKWNIDLDQAREYQALLDNMQPFKEKLIEVHKEGKYEGSTDPDFMLYDGGFFSDADRTRLEQVRSEEPQAMASLGLPFTDPRLPEMVFRFRARNYPETLSQQEQDRWNEFRRTRLLEDPAGCGLGLEEYTQTLQDLRRQEDLTPEDIKILDALEAYGKTLNDSL